MDQLKKKNIVIIGAGITGLTLLHFLMQKYKDRPDVDVWLFEKNDQPGGTIRSISKAGGLFEAGPSGFLGIKERTFQLIDALNARDELLEAEAQAKARHICVNNILYQLPADFKTFFGFKLLNIFEKMRFLSEAFVKKTDCPSESVYDFAKRRFGQKAADYLADPFVAGIYAGEARTICLKAAFPQIYAWEQQYGSILKAARRTAKNRTKPVLYSFKNGMGQIIDILYEKYKDRIKLKEEIIKVFLRESRYVISTDKENYKADELYVCTPAYAAAQLMKHLDQEIADELMYITYAPVAVVGLLCPDDVFKRKPYGFGYLVPSLENKEILGVLFESNVFANRAPKNHILFRVMVGGSRYPDIFQKSKKEILELAMEEIGTVFPTKGTSALTKIDLRKVMRETFLSVWDKAIPQYDQVNTQMQEQIDKKLKRFRDLYLLGNYRDGVSFNDCIESAYQAALSSSL
ncbi:MAG TPA: protoporphyrinogen oxidase [Candidatus Omnitrophota bacterium]|nr:protoporphyrinogen oxidase [Candidatus Omnitrophota bacterium]